MSINKLYKQTREVPNTLLNLNKYTYFSQYNIIPIKYLDINDSLTNTNVELKQFIASYGRILLFPNIVNGQITDITIRSVDGRGHLKLGSRVFPYNIGNLRKDFKYGDKLFLVEGIGDLITLKLIKPELDIIAMQSTSLSKNSVDFLSNITNNFILIRDNDNSGLTGANKMLYMFKRLGLNLEVKESFNMFNTKDAGDLLDKLKVYHKTGDTNLLSQIQLMQNYYEIILK